MGFNLQTHGIIQSGGAPIIERPSNAAAFNVSNNVIFNGAMDSLNSNTFTIGGWYYFDSSFIYNDNSLIETDDRNQLTQLQSTLNLRTTIDEESLISHAGLSEDTWYFIMIRGYPNGGNVRVYTESIYISQADTNNDWGNGLLLSSTLNFGGRIIGRGEGKLNAIGFWDRVLTDLEVDNLWNNGLGVSYVDLNGLGLDLGLLDWWDLDYTTTSNELNDIGTITGTINFVPI